MPFERKIEGGAAREIDNLPDNDLVREAIELIDDLCEDPFPPDAIKMRKSKGSYRVRFGGDAYRIVYRVDDRKKRIVVQSVRARPVAYKGYRG